MKNKYYRINKILNNNAIEILENGTEIIIIGNGVGFNHKVNDYITMKENYKLYTLQNNLLKIQFKALLNEMPFKCIELTQEIIDMAKTDLNRNFNQGLLVSLSDHINFVSKNYLKGYGSYSLVSEEIKRFYHEEYEVGLKALDLINRYYQINLNKKEASAIAFHLINAEFNNNVSKTTSILKSIDDILNIIEANLGLELQEDSLYYSRLVIHLKFFMQRVIKGESDDENFEKLIISAKSDINKKIGITLDSIERYLNEEFDYVLSEAERFYLLVHISRII
ncbi:PRD domain-containing protein [Thomasclavelia ramosa]|uniref:PRD domain-containing protein n=1 Tax=Thomasclavelia ramosa TaxID=1547 RepID=UPI00233ED51F|nr:PRD domain-containing protein [Thomasclavelia ramosa]MDC2832990.1 PRD domain-containing protein [Thomasclavelia ramosa]